MILYTTIDSMIGTLGIVRSAKGLTQILFENESPHIEEIIHRKFPLAKIHKDREALASTVNQLLEYFDGKRKKFELDLDLMLPPFHDRALKEVFKIPYGKTASYKEIAERIGNPKAVRAVGNANANNPIPIVIPCHRVLATGGGLGGYGGGLDVKASLLKLEGAI